MTRRRKPNGSAHDPVRSVRVSNMVWLGAQGRAEEEDRTMSEVVALLVKGYADGMINLPTVQLVYTPGPVQAPSDAAPVEA